jgi:hypothetical protein
LENKNNIVPTRRWQHENPRTTQGHWIFSKKTGEETAQTCSKIKKELRALSDSLKKEHLKKDVETITAKSISLQMLLVIFKGCF